MSTKLRIGNGYDVHRLVTGRPLILGGVTIKWHLGLDGHSDADVLLHAICDALLGAAGLGDIGVHFPPSDEKHKNQNSREFLHAVFKLLQTNGYQIVNLDSTVIAEKPKLRPYIDEMRSNIAVDLKLLKEQVNVKATTTEGLGFCGEEQGIAASTTVLIEKI